MPIVNTSVPITSQSCRQAILALAENYPFVRAEVIGASGLGQPLYGLTIGTGSRKVLYTAAHHANEWITAYVLLQFAQELAEAIAPKGQIFGVDAATLAQSATVHLVPMVDPDGVDLVTGAIAPGSQEYLTAQELAANYPDIPFPEGWKADLAGVDLNLQYPAGWLQAREIKFTQGFTRPGPRDYVGKYPLSQPESCALAAYTQQTDPELVLAYHTQGSVIYWQFQDYEVPGALELGQLFARLSGYALEDTPYTSAFAGYKDWFIKYFRKPGYTIEAGLGENPLPLTDFPRIYRDNLGILVTAALPPESR